MIDVEFFVRLRREKNLSQKQLAAAVGVSQQLIGEIEAGRTLSTKAIYKIARTLGTTANRLDSEIPGVEGLLAKLEHELSELDEEQATCVLERFASDIEFAKRGRRPE